MALVDEKRVEAYKEKDSGLRIDTEEGTKAILVMKQPGNPNTRRVSKKPRKHGWHTDKEKLEAATLFAAVGSYRRVHELTGIPEATLSRWGMEDWWLLTLQRVRREENADTDKKFSAVVDKALDKLMDRIEHGDYVYDIKRGTAVQVPVGARDLAIVTGTVFDKRQLLRGEATRITSASTSEEHLKALADKFAAFVKEKKEKVVEGEVLKNNEE